MNIIEDPLTNNDVIQLLEQHMQDMHATSPAESVHALDIDALKHPDISFFSVYEAGTLHACGAIKKLDNTHAEIKSMRTATQSRGKGIASALLTHILKVCKQRGYQRVSLETGTPDYFVPARKMYQKFGFKECGPFAHYTLDPYSLFMTKKI